MRWKSRKSALKRWIERHRQSCIDDVVVVPLFPKKCGYGEGADVVWLSPVRRLHKSSSWEPKGFLDTGYSSWSEYQADATWKEWRETRPRHHLAGLINLLVYWGWYWGIVAGACWWMLHGLWS